MIIELPSTKKAQLSILNLNHSTRRAIRLAALRHGQQLREEAKQQILKQGNRTGRIYKIRDKRFGSGFRPHQASAAGEYPASRSGALWRSLGFDVRGATTLEFGAGRIGAPSRKTGNASRYARILELGGRAGRNRSARIEPREYLLQTIQNKERDLTKSIDKEMANRFRNIR